MLRRLGALGAAGGVVAGAGEDDRRGFRAFGDDDDGVELDAVAHGDHDDALFVVRRGDGGDGGRFEVGVQLVGDGFRRVLLLGEGVGRGEGGEAEREGERPGDTIHGRSC